MNSFFQRKKVEMIQITIINVMIKVDDALMTFPFEKVNDLTDARESFSFFLFPLSRHAVCKFSAQIKFVYCDRK